MCETQPYVGINESYRLFYSPTYPQLTQKLFLHSE